MKYITEQTSIREFLEQTFGRYVIPFEIYFLKQTFHNT